MPTKTEQYLKILAEGGDAPTDCCMTNTQKLIAEAIDRINNLQPGGGGSGAILPLIDYLDLENYSLTNIDELTDAIAVGKGFYLIDPVSNLGILFQGEIDGNNIKFRSLPFFGGTTLGTFDIVFDKNTGALDPSQAGGTIFNFSHSTTEGAYTYLGLGKLTINIGSDTYEYDGSSDVSITILDGESMGF